MKGNTAPFRLGSIGWRQNAPVIITDIDIDMFDDDLFDIYYKYPLDSLSCRNTIILTDGTEEFEEDYYQTSCKNSLYFDIASIYFSDDDPFEIKFKSDAYFGFANLTIKPMICNLDKSIYSIQSYVSDIYIFTPENVASLKENYIIFEIKQLEGYEIENEDELQFSLNLGSEETFYFTERVWKLDLIVINDKNKSTVECTLYNEYLNISSSSYTNLSNIIDVTLDTDIALWLDWTDNSVDIDTGIRFGYGDAIGQGILCTAPYYSQDGWKYSEINYIEINKTITTLPWNIVDKYGEKICYESDLYNDINNRRRSLLLNDLPSIKTWTDDCAQSWFIKNLPSQIGSLFK